MQKHTFFIKGMHCNSCVLLTEMKIGEHGSVREVKANLSSLSVEVAGDFGDKTPEEIAEELSRTIREHGYSLLLEREEREGKWDDFKLAVPIALGFAFLFVLLQKLGIVNLVSAGEVTYGTAFVVGIIASLSTCMAVVGGLVLSMSATFAKEGQKVKPQMMFHIGRLVSFFILGGVIGAIGGAFTLSPVAIFVLSVLIGLVMLIMGLNLLEVFPWAKKLSPRMPKRVGKWVYGVTTPVLLGVATFFLPCGFTQSMQLYTLTTGSFLSGGLTMLAFALGTLPALALLSFSSLGISKSPKAGVFFKAAGLVVIMFALFNLINSLAAIGIIPGIFGF